MALLTSDQPYQPEEFTVFEVAQRRWHRLHKTDLPAKEKLTQLRSLSVLHDYAQVMCPSRSHHPTVTRSSVLAVSILGSGSPGVEIVSFISTVPLPHPSGTRPGKNDPRCRRDHRQTEQRCRVEMCSIAARSFSPKKRARWLCESYNI
jgi:hypothetical protein